MSSDREKPAGSIPRLPQVIGLSRQVVVVAKPAGFHSVAGRTPQSVAEFLAARFPECQALGSPDYGLVHRLDRDTSGLLIAARTAPAHENLRAAFRDGEAVKHYLALVSGRLDRPRTIGTPLADDSRRVKTASRFRPGRPATTEVWPLRVGSDWSLVLARMKTGVRHQIRVHLASAGHALIGDAVYGEKADKRAGDLRPGHMLHALSVDVGGQRYAVGPDGDFLEAWERYEGRGRRFTSS